MDPLINELVSALDNESFYLVRRPVLLVDDLDRRFPGGAPRLLVSPDHADPLPAFVQTKAGKRIADRISGWRSLSDLTDINPALRPLLEDMRAQLPTRMASASPALQPALDQLLAGLGRHSTNQMNWTWLDKRRLLATLYAEQTPFELRLRLRITGDGLDKWPQLAPKELDELQRMMEKYPVSWVLRPAEVAELLAALD